MRYFLLLILFSNSAWAQYHSQEKYELETDYFYGNILEHNPAIGHLITHHPQGMLFHYQRKTFGEKTWQSAYNFPDYGASFLYQDMGNPFLGDHYGVFLHYGFYFFNRSLQLQAGQGISYNTNPYDRNDNYQNIAYGSKILPAVYFQLKYKKKVFNQLGLQLGLLLVHYSNGNIKAPNTSTNTFALTMGANYSFVSAEKRKYSFKEYKNFTEAFRFNFVFRGGIQSSDVIGMGQFPFYNFGVYADKRLSYKSSITGGTEIFLSPMLKELIYFRSVAYPDSGVSSNADSRRAGVFLGYQLHIGKLHAFANLGYYLYYPYDFEGRVYNRIGLQHQVYKDLFAGFSVKSHAAKAEAFEFSIGYRL